MKLNGRIRLEASIIVVVFAVSAAMAMDEVRVETRTDEAVSAFGVCCWSSERRVRRKKGRGTRDRGRGRS